MRYCFIVQDMCMTSFFSFPLYYGISNLWKDSVFHMTCYSFFAQAQHTFLMTENQCQALRTGNLLFIYYSKWWKSTRVASSRKKGFLSPNRMLLFNEKDLWLLHFYVNCRLAFFPCNFSSRLLFRGLFVHFKKGIIKSKK